MMDPFTAIGVVSGILSFVDAAEKVVKLSWTLYNSVEGSSEETEMRLKLADSMAVIYKRLVIPNQSAPTEEDRALAALAQECNELTNDIKKELQDLKPKRRKSKTQSGLVALKTLLVEPKIKELEKRIQRCRDQLHFHMTTLSSENLKTLLATCKEDGAKLAQLELAITQLRQTLQDSATTKTDPIRGQALNQLQHLLNVEQDALHDATHDRILRRIEAGFEDMSYRYQSVDSPFGETFEWIFDLDGTSPEAAKFTQWLSSGDGVFHICGKLGSGKSTLMKKLYGSKRTRAELEKWSHAKGGRKLITANYFFYALGSDPRQKSLMGLYRTMLYQILDEIPCLMQNLLPDQWTKALSKPKAQAAYEILDDDIKQAYERLSKQQSSLGGYSFCFFVDGLDEFQTTTAVDRREMVRSLTDLASSTLGCIKLCVSSRIENPFMDTFSEDTRLYLHELTKSDMEEYVRGKLQCVGTLEERQQLASSITKKAEGVFLWVVLVVQNIRKRSDDGARFSRLLSEIESLPTEMDDLFRRILDTLGTEDRRLVSHTVSLLRFSGGIPLGKKMHMGLTLSDFYFLEDYEVNRRFAESAQFLKPGSETAKECELRARRQLRGVCRGLVEADKANNVEFTHRSVGNFFQQEKVRMEMHDESFNNLEALCQLKLATIRHYWWDAERQNGNNAEDMKLEEVILTGHSELVACLIELRRRQRLDATRFDFLACLDTIPLLSVGTTISRALNWRKTAVRVALCWKHYKGRQSPYYHYEICHFSRVRHTQSNDYWEHSYRGNAVAEGSGTMWKYIEEPIDEIEDYSRALISPLFTELCSGRLDYPRWRMARIHDMPLESESLAMLVADDDGDDVDEEYENPESIRMAGLFFRRYLFERQFVSPNLPTHLAFGGEFGFIRIAAGNQRLSIWQHFLCWWATVAAASGEFDPEVPSPDDESPSDDEFDDDEHIYNPREQLEASFVLENFIIYGADLQLAIKFAERKGVETAEDDCWIRWTLEMTLSGGEVLTVDVVVNLESRMELEEYPYGPPNKWWEKNWCGTDKHPALPDSALSVRDMIHRSRATTKDHLLRLIDERLGVAKAEDVLMPYPNGDEPEDVQML